MTAPRPLAYNDNPSKDEHRPAYAAGLRHLADLIEAGQAPFPYSHLDLFLAYGSLTVDEQAAAARKLTRALGGGTWKKDVGTGTMALDGMCGGVPIRIYVAREAVCERVVVGTEEVTEVIPAVTEADLRPEQTVTRTVERVEWRCGSILDAAAETPDAVEVSA